MSLLKANSGRQLQEEDMLKERMEQGRGIPESANPETVAQFMSHLCDLLEKELSAEYKWLASCTVAVEAGLHGARRRINRRLRLRGMIRQCAAFLGVDDPTACFPDGWEQVRIYAGYGAVSKYARERELDLKLVIVAEGIATAGRKGACHFIRQDERAEA